VITGICVAGIAFANVANFTRLLDFVEADLTERLRSLRIKAAKLRFWIQTWIVIVAVSFLVLWLGLDLLPLAALLAIFMLAGPWYVIRRLSRARKEKIEEQLADAMVMFSNNVRAGLSLAQSMERLSINTPKPINQEFAQIAGEYNLGKPLERTLTEAKDRLKSENFVLFSAALLASRQSGGKLNETVERISTSVREIQRLERKIQSDTAQARKSAVYMAISPAAILAAFTYMDRSAVEVLWTTNPGMILLCGAIVLNVAAYFWSVKILNPDI